MNGPEHYAAAERALDRAGEDERQGGPFAYHLGCAQVHATLALAAATAMGSTGMARVDYAAWDARVGVPLPDSD